jgi:hypothetical protein
MKPDLRQLTTIDGPFKDYSGYQQSRGIIGKTVEAIGYIERTPTQPTLTIILFTDGTYLKCETWCE